MREILNIIKQIQATSGRNDKESIIRANKDNEDFVQLLKYVYDPYITLGVGKLKLNKFIKKVKGDNNEFDDLFHLLRYLTLHNTGSDSTLLKVAEFINAEQDEEMKEFYSECIKKTLRIGASGKVINKALGKEWIPEFNVMLARSYADESEKVTGKFYVTLKVDGHRLLAIKENGRVKFFTRQGQSVNGLIDIEDELEQLPDNTVYDGELLLRNENNLHSKDLYRETTKVARTEGVKNNLEFHVFDILPLEEFKQGKSKLVYKDRRSKMDTLFSAIDLEWVKLLPVLYYGDDKKEVLCLADEQADKGFEGVMLNLANGLYTTNRSKSLLKVKKFQDCDARIIDIVEGDGKYIGKLGKLVIEYKGASHVGVGTGFTDAQREEMYLNKDKYIGRVAKIKYFEESSNSKTGELSLRFPVFEEIRWDKTEPSFH